LRRSVATDCAYIWLGGSRRRGMRRSLQGDLLGLETLTKRSTKTPHNTRQGPRQKNKKEESRRKKLLARAGGTIGDTERQKRGTKSPSEGPGPAKT